MLLPVWDKLADGPLAPLAYLGRDDLDSNIPNEENPLLRSLLSAVPSKDSGLSWSDEEPVIYRDAAVQLPKAFAFARHLGPSLTVWDALSAWPMRVSLGYLSLLRAHHPGALLLLAYYAVLLRRLEPCWYIGEDRATKLLDSIRRLPDGRWRELAPTNG